MRAGVVARTFITAVALSSVMAGAALSERKDPPEEKLISPWPPLTMDRQAIGNWPVPHPAPAHDIFSVPAAKAFRDASLGERKRIQAGLIRAGLYAGEIDGKWGPATFNGVLSYAAQMNISNHLNTYSGSASVLHRIAITVLRFDSGTRPVR